MTKVPPARPKILILFSDTGGGHRSAAEAIIEALRMDYGEQISTEMVDIFLEYAPPPLDKIPALYPRMVRAPRAWGVGYRISNGHRRARLLTDTFWPYVRQAALRLIWQHPCDMIVSVHPLANGPVLRALGKNHPPYITVVTDLVTTHAMWYHHGVDLCIVPTEAASQRALDFGMQPRQLRVVGLPVADRFCQPAGNRHAIRSKLGWPQDMPVVLLVGGGEGMGPIKQTAQTIALSGLPIALAVIAGRNMTLKSSLEAMEWPLPTYIYGFVREMPDFMRAADVLVTKAGPGTISEAFNAALPIIMYSRLPGQEDGNVAYTVAKGAGIWAPTPEEIVSTLQVWIKQPEERLKAQEACRRLARPRAAHEIAGILAQRLGIEAVVEEHQPPD
jgi:1,2-diacylglycerol 3-beta-galactosyltransferase